MAEPWTVTTAPFSSRCQQRNSSLRITGQSQPHRPAHRGLRRQQPLARLRAPARPVATIRRNPVIVWPAGRPLRLLTVTTALAAMPCNLVSGFQGNPAPVDKLRAPDGIIAAAALACASSCVEFIHCSSGRPTARAAPSPAVNAVEPNIIGTPRWVDGRPRNWNFQRSAASHRVHPD